MNSDEFDQDDHYLVMTTFKLSGRILSPQKFYLSSRRAFIFSVRDFIYRTIFHFIKTSCSRLDEMKVVLTTWIFDLILTK